MNEDDSLIVKLPIGVVVMTSPTDGSSSDAASVEENKSVYCKAKTWCKKSKLCGVHYIILAIIGLLTWGLFWVILGDDWIWDGPFFRLAVVVVTAWASGLVLQEVTDFPPLLAALLTGIVARNLGYLDMRNFTSIDMFLRSVYPVIVLGKGSLGWDISFMKENWKRIVPLGVIPWILDVLTLATCMYFFLGHPFIWGLLFGTFFASLSTPVVMPTVIKIGCSPQRTRVWPQLVGTSAGIDTALSVGVFGVIFSFMFSQAGETYRYFKAATTLFVGLGVGVLWGCIAGALPLKTDLYVTELRILLVVLGGIFLSFFTSKMGWVGVAGVAVLACNAVAAKFWSREGWKINNNPASTAYRVMWSACEPALFAYTGTFFEMKRSMTLLFLYGLAIIAICLTIRLGAAALMCWGMSRHERLFICLCWSPKTIVQAVLSPLPINALIVHGGTESEIKYAEDILRLTIQAILFTTPFVFVLIKYFGPGLLKDKEKDCENDIGS